VIVGAQQKKSDLRLPRIIFARLVVGLNQSCVGTTS
jgi:hypothetical protein